MRAFAKKVHGSKTIANYIVNNCITNFILSLNIAPSKNLANHLPSRCRWPKLSVALKIVANPVDRRGKVKLRPDVQIAQWQCLAILLRFRKMPARMRVLGLIP